MRIGRPVSEDPRAYKIGARLTAAELEEFEAYARRQGLTNAEVIKRGIRMQIDSGAMKQSQKVLSETLSIFKSGGEKQIEDRMVRACLNDLDKVRDQLKKEVNALPTAKRNMIKNVINNYLKDIVEDFDDGN